MSNNEIKLKSQFIAAFRLVNFQAFDAFTAIHFESLKTHACKIKAQTL